jgi:hypothetical protein
MNANTLTLWNLAGPLICMPIFIGFGLHCWLRDRRESATIKRQKALPRAMTLACIFVAYAFLQTGCNYRVLWIIAPVAMIIWVNMRNTKYCDKCNATIYNHNWITETISYCPRCGASLEPKHKGEEHLNDWKT